MEEIFLKKKIRVTWKIALVYLWGKNLTRWLYVVMKRIELKAMRYTYRLQYGTVPIETVFFSLCIFLLQRKQFYVYYNTHVHAVPLSSSMYFEWKLYIIKYFQCQIYNTNTHIIQIFAVKKVGVDFFLSLWVGSINSIIFKWPKTHR